MKTNLLKLSALALLVTLAAGCADDGDDGLTGPQGDLGQVGADGSDGSDGSNGADGQDGADGNNGQNGNLAVYTVTITNLTYGQPFSPASVVAHEPGYYPFVAGESASVALEMLAEGGSPTALIDEASTVVQFLDAQQGGGTPPRMMGSETTLVVPMLDADNLRLSVLTMLVDTNDAFTGLNAMDISNMTVGQKVAFTTISWDSGTEANIETAATMPGPAAQSAGGGGASAGFSDARDDRLDVVHVHRGAVTQENADDPSKEGLVTSILTEGDRWLNPTAKIVVVRTR
ncbi:MAG: outer membrane murein-binding lipoprotein Lpp [Glaciecola sp.]|jgi:outer membrane murein-binding lipoprotein Lpp